MIDLDEVMAWDKMKGGKIMQAYEGYFENGQFYPVVKTANRPGRQRAFLMVLNESAESLKPKGTEGFLEGLNRLTKEAASEEKELRAAWLKKLDAAINLSLDENIPDIPRSTLMREPLDLAD